MSERVYCLREIFVFQLEDKLIYFVYWIYSAYKGPVIIYIQGWGRR